MGDDLLVLLLGPAPLAYVRAEVVVPPLAALLPEPSPELTGDEGPLLLPVLPDELDDPGVLLGGPGSLDEAGPEDLR